MWHPTSALVAEIVSPGDESWQKLSFYATHNVDEVVTVDPSERIVTWMTMPGSPDPAGRAEQGPRSGQPGWRCLRSQMRSTTVPREWRETC
jgi:Uma2 family endonuclease